MYDTLSKISLTLWPFFINRHLKGLHKIFYCLKNDCRQRWSLPGSHCRMKEFPPLLYNLNITLSLRMMLTFSKITESVLFPVAIMPSISVGAIVGSFQLSSIFVACFHYPDYLFICCPSTHFMKDHVCHFHNECLTFTASINT